LCELLRNGVRSRDSILDALFSMVERDAVIVPMEGELMFWKRRTPKLPMIIDSEGIHLPGSPIHYLGFIIYLVLLLPASIYQRTLQIRVGPRFEPITNMALFKTCARRAERERQWEK
jgi:hypothetical protein